MPAKQPKESRLWFSDGSCIRLRPGRRTHVWSHDLVEARTHDGRKFRLLNLIDAFTRQCPAIRIDQKLGSSDVIDLLSDLFILRGGTIAGAPRAETPRPGRVRGPAPWAASTQPRTG